MTHFMKLNEQPFAMIARGQKTIELRLCDEKRQLVQPGDQIVFTKADGQQLTAQVVKLHRFADFAQLYKTLPLEKCGYTSQELDHADPKDMEVYYSAQQQKKYGVLGIEIALV